MDVALFSASSIFQNSARETLAKIKKTIGDSLASCFLPFCENIINVEQTLQKYIKTYCFEIVKTKSRETDPLEIFLQIANCSPYQAHRRKMVESCLARGWAAGGPLPLPLPPSVTIM